MNEEIKDIQQKNYRKEHINIYWVHSHAESKMNESVDIEAKKAVEEVVTNHSISDKDKLLHPNKYISHQTIKSEINYRTNKYDDIKWMIYKYEQKDKYRAHYYHLNVPWNPKKHGDEMQYLEGKDNILRLMLITNQIPTNWYMVHKTCNITYDTWCESWQCKQIQFPETIKHILFECPNDNYQI